ncbi:PREDICTED: type-2 histone deacetylase 1-like isoform X2 [Rhagoletis zephyria]|uniref:type-2 histone deacetylase 1-like isoform X2 n=1 Tax=Rhagoletis zephyria TaxID=28612 RepID=UPI0008118EE0|nr:PREDICTED: type-2 histone deacetylase 1-like isoform X2 [Rhagoletis zephyria]
MYSIRFYITSPTSLYKKMLPTDELCLVSRLILICLTLRRFSAAQMYYEDDPCDFGIYKGICLRASKCMQLPVLMKEMTLKSADVGHCGFTTTEEIICCPQAPAPAAKALPNKLEDIFKPFEFRAPLEDETTTRTIQPIPANFWFSNNLKESNIDGESVSRSKDESAPVSWPKVDNSARENTIFNGNQISNQRPLTDEGINEENARRINDIFNTNPDQQATLIEGNAGGINGILNANSAPVSLSNAADTQRLDAIFNVNPVPSRIPLADTNQRLDAIFNLNPLPSGIPPVDNTQRINEIFNEQLIPIGNKINGIDQTRQINSVFNGNLTPTGAAFGSIDADAAQRINAIFNTNTATSGIPIEDNTPVNDGRNNPLGNINNNNTRGINIKLNDSPLPSGIPIEVNTGWPNAVDYQNIPPTSVLNRNPAPNWITIQDNTQKIDSAFNAGTVFAGDDVGQRINSIFNTNPVPKVMPIEENAQRFNAIFNGNPVQTANEINNDPFHNFLKQPRNERLPANREIVDMPVQQPPLPLARHFRPQFGRVEQQ